VYITFCSELQQRHSKVNKRLHLLIKLGEPRVQLQSKIVLIKAETSKICCVEGLRAIMEIHFGVSRALPLLLKYDVAVNLHVGCSVIEFPLRKALRCLIR
jgi:hypothetical protein